MIEYLKGEITELDPTKAIIECAGVGYECNISVYTYDKLRTGQVFKLFIDESIREDAHLLYGFISKQERAIYRLLISVSGVGPNTARCIQSSLSPDELVAVISTGNDRQLKNVKGIGSKTAQRIIVDLKDKIVALGIADEIPVGGSMQVAVNNLVKDEAVSALTMLGFSPAPSQKVVVDILKQKPDAPVEEVVKLALKQIK